MRKKVSQTEEATFPSPGHILWRIIACIAGKMAELRQPFEPRRSKWREPFLSFVPFSDMFKTNICNPRKLTSGVSCSRKAGQQVP